MATLFLAGAPVSIGSVWLDGSAYPHALHAGGERLWPAATLIADALGPADEVFARGRTDIANVNGFTAGAIHRRIPGTFRATVQFPATAPTGGGCIFEAGGGGRGAYLGVLADGRIILRGGDGSTMPDTPDDDRAQILIPYSALAGQTVTLEWEFVINPGRARLWADGELIGTGSTVTAAMRNNEFAGGNAGAFDASGANVTRGCPGQRWPGGVLSDLEYWRSAAPA